MTYNQLIRASIGLFAFVLTSCASTEPPTIFVPTQDAAVVSYYRNGLPIGAIDHDSSLIMFSLEPTVLVDTKYMRLWFLYRNGSNAPFLLEPMKCLKLSIDGADDAFQSILPESPSFILANIENAKAASLIMEAIGGTLQGLSAQSTTISNQHGEKWTVNDRGEKVQAANDRTDANMRETAYYYKTFKESINSGILRRNTIFTGESVNGYIYFPLGSMSAFSGKYFKNRNEYVYSLTISTPWGIERVEFTQEAGE